MKIVINGVELDVPPDAALEIGRDDEGQLMVYVDEAGNPLGFGTMPEPALAQFLSNSAAKSAACDCPTCRQDRARARGDSVAKHPPADIAGELVAAPWWASFKSDLIDAVVGYIDEQVGEDALAVLHDRAASGQNIVIAVAVTPGDLGLSAEPVEKEEF